MPQSPTTTRFTLALTRFFILLALLGTALISPPAQAHDIQMSTADVTIEDQTVTLTAVVDLDHLIASYGVPSYQRSQVIDDYMATGEPNADPSSQEMIQQIHQLWPQMRPGLRILADEERLAPTLSAIHVPPPSLFDASRVGALVFTADIPDGATAVQIGWPAPLGPLLLVRKDSEHPVNRVVQDAALSPPMPINGNAFTSLPNFTTYVWLGFEHIIPKGADHICFVLGLFFFSTALRPLLWQVTGFTLGHSVSLAAGALDLITIPASIVEPLIAASIVFVGVENILAKGISPWRSWIVLAFGLIHGLGFASVLSELGMGTGSFIASLIGFNIGVELGQLAVIAIAFLTVGFWFAEKPWYRTRIAIPASVVISAFGAVWLLQRTVLV